MMERIAQEIRELRERIIRHNHRYYVLNAPEIPDAQYDRLFQRLLELEESYPNLATPDSPSLHVGMAPAGASPRIEHRLAMLGLDHGFGEEALRGFDAKIREGLGKELDFDYVVEPQIDGVAAELVYERGTLKVASTRGDGLVGEDVTVNVKTILTVPLTLTSHGRVERFPELLEVRGEVYMEREALETLNRMRMAKGFRPFSSSRQAAADSLRQKDRRVAARRPLNLFCHGVGEWRGSECKTYYGCMLSLQAWGFRIDRPHMRICATIEQVVEYCHHLENVRRAFPFDVDGAVIKVNPLNLQVRLGRKSRSPNWAFAWKFKPAGQGELHSA